MLNNEGSAYLPDAYKDLFSKLKRRRWSSSDTRAEFTIPGISAFNDAAIGRGVDPIVNVLPSYLAFTFTVYSLSFFAFTLSNVISSSTHKKIRAAQATPIAKPK